MTEALREVISRSSEAVMVYGSERSPMETLDGAAKQPALGCPCVQAKEAKPAAHNAPRGRVERELQRVTERVAHEETCELRVVRESDRFGEVGPRARCLLRVAITIAEQHRTSALGIAAADGHGARRGRATGAPCGGGCPQHVVCHSYRQLVWMQLMHYDALEESLGVRNGSHQRSSEVIRGH